MTGKIKTLGLALFAFAAFGAIAAQAGMAGSLHVGAQPSVVTGEDTANHVFTHQATDSTITTTTCQVARFEGTLQGLTNVTEGTVTPAFSGCKYAIFFNAEVLMNGCKFTITGQSNAENQALTAWIDIVGCTTGKHIEIKSPAICTFTIDEQNTLSHLTFENVAGTSPPHIKLLAHVTGIETTQDGGWCPDGDNHHARDLALTGTTTVKAFQDAGTDQVQKPDHQYTEHTCGQQVSLTAT